MLSPTGVVLVTQPVWPSALAVALVTLATLAIGTWTFRLSRTTSDFLVASRTVRPVLNASAISGEYLSAASFLGVAGLLLTFGADMLWYSVGWTAGYLVLLVLVAAPLRRSGAYTLPDFAEARLGSRTTRAFCTALVVMIGWLYLIPQFMGAGLTMGAALGVPRWVGALLVAVVVLANVTSGGMRSITFVQAFQFWLKLTALLVPAVALAMVWIGDGSPSASQQVVSGVSEGWTAPIGGPGGQGLYSIWSLVVATFLGVMGLPHVVVRFYTNPDGRAARRTTLLVLALVGAFFLLPPVYGALGRIYAPEHGIDADVLVLELPRLMLSGGWGIALSALVTAGAFAAFLSTSSGLVMAVAGVLGQDVTSRPVRGRRMAGLAAYRMGAVLAVLLPVGIAVLEPSVGLAQMVGSAFAVTASTFCPLLVLGIWWRGLTAPGAMAGLVVGGATSGAAAVWTMVSDADHGWWSTLLTQPAAWSVPLAFGTMVAVSRLTRSEATPDATRFMVRLHTPEDVSLDRGWAGEARREGREDA